MKVTCKISFDNNNTYMWLCKKYKANDTYKTNLYLFSIM